MNMEQVVKNRLEHFEKLTKIGVGTWDEKLWKKELILLKSLQEECCK